MYFRNSANASGIRGLMRAIVHYCFIAGALLALVACDGDGEDGSDSANEKLPLLDPVNPGPGFVSAASEAEQMQLIQKWWSALTEPLCWDSSFVGDPTIGGTPASVVQFRFYGNYQYRYFGFNTYVGSVSFYDIGKYYGKTTAIVSTYSDPEAITILDENTIANFNRTPSGTPFVRYLGAADRGCL